jgi:tRNA threonylcarbamoyladenosine biosynthesis protein TsaE
MSAGKKAYPDHIIEYSLKDIDTYATTVANLLPVDGEIYFEGSMGAGKTTFIKAILRSLGVRDVISSPTFSLINTYQLPDEKVVYHVDLYRVKDETELFDIGFEEYLESDSLLFIEWPERMTSLFNQKAMLLEIDIISEDMRKLKIYQS